MILVLYCSGGPRIDEGKCYSREISEEEEEEEGYGVNIFFNTPGRALC